MQYYVYTLVNVCKTFSYSHLVFGFTCYTLQTEDVGFLLMLLYFYHQKQLFLLFLNEQKY